jgi:hypothetical protein
VDDIPRRHVTGGGLDRVAETDRGLFGGLPLHRRTSRTGDRRGHAAAVPELCVGRIGDRIDVEPRHIGLLNL